MKRGTRERRGAARAGLSEGELWGALRRRGRRGEAAAGDEVEPHDRRGLARLRRRKRDQRRQRRCETGRVTGEQARRVMPRLRRLARVSGEVCERIDRSVARADHDRGVIALRPNHEARRGQDQEKQREQGRAYGPSPCSRLLSPHAQHRAHLAVLDGPPSADIPALPITELLGTPRRPVVPQASRTAGGSAAHRPDAPGPGSGVRPGRRSARRTAPWMRRARTDP